ncbi:MAG TPA: trypsin-like peptidase domain-containing protein [Bryobacteraceae bacterium]|nr:trypsin-like peptidase domain-containing protein [Bryobacteraceae bacterium]
MHRPARHAARSLWRAAYSFSRRINPLLAFLIVGAMASAFANQVPPVSREPDSLLELSSQMRWLSQQVSPAVVQVLVTGYGLTDSDSGHAVSLVEREKSIGSGVIVDPDGYIMTNAHVVKGAISIRVVLTEAAAGLEGGIENGDEDDSGNSKTEDAKIVGIDQESDLALLKIDGKRLPTLQFMNSDRLRQGDLVLALGAPLGLRNSVSFGVVSSPDRLVSTGDPMVYIQTDASINPGNSGGALVTMTGVLAGINTFIVSQSGGNEGLGFAIPANTVRDVYRQLRKDGHVSRGEIGIYAQDINVAMARGLSLARDHGVIVSDVVEDGPADRSGLQRRDIILSLDGHRMVSAAQMESNIFRRSAGDKLDLRILRGQQELNIVCAVRERPDRSSLLGRLIHPERNVIARLGILCIEIDKNVAAMIPGLRHDYGLIVAAKTAGGQSQSIDLQPGDIIDAMNNSPIALLDTFRSQLNHMKPGDPVVLQIERDGRFQYLAFELDR